MIWYMPYSVVYVGLYCRVTLQPFPEKKRKEMFFVQNVCVTLVG